MLTALAAAATLAVVSPGPVTALAASGTNVAFASAPTARDCDRVYLWTTRGRPLPLGRPRPCGDRLSTGRGLSALALAGDRALWLTYAGGNIREWSLWTATRTRPQPRLLRFVPRDVDSPSPVVVGAAGGGLLPYAVDRTVIALRANGSRAFVWTAPVTPVALAAAPAQVVATLAGGRVVVLDSTGAVVGDRTYDGSVVEALPAGGGLVLRRLRSLTLGAASWPLPARARLEDVQGSLAAYTIDATLHLLRLDTGRESTLALAPPAHAQLEGARLYVSSARLLRNRPMLSSP